MGVCPADAPQALHHVGSAKDQGTRRESLPGGIVCDTASQTISAGSPADTSEMAKQTLAKNEEKKGPSNEDFAKPQTELNQRSVDDYFRYYGKVQTRFSIAILIEYFFFAIYCFNLCSFTRLKN